jgi:hypothetical protein
MHHGIVAAEHPVVAVRALDAHARLVAGHHRGPAQSGERRLTAGGKPRLRPAQHGHQPALADGQPEQVGQRSLKPLIGERLEALQVDGRGVQPRAEGRRRRPGRTRGRNTRLTGRAGHGQAAVLLHDRPHGRQLDALVRADRLGRQVGRQHKAAVGAACGPVLDDPIGILGKGAAVAFVPRLGPAGAGLLAAFLAVRGGRLGGGARGLLRALQPEHQLDQFVLAQAFEIGASHDARESASSVPRKGGARAERSASRQPRRTTPWVITSRLGNWRRA